MYTAQCLLSIDSSYCDLGYTSNGEWSFDIPIILYSPEN